MKIYKVEISILDLDETGKDGIIETIESTKFPNYCINPTVEKIECRDIGKWSDDHLLNKHDTFKEEYERLFNEKG